MLTTDDVRAQLGIDPADTGDDAWLDQTTAAVNVWVAALPVIVERPNPADPWPADVHVGAVLLAAHLYQSRNAPYGRAGLDSMGNYQAAYADPEISRLLRLRRWSRPFLAGAADSVALWPARGSLAPSPGDAP